MMRFKEFAELNENVVNPRSGFSASDLPALIVLRRRNIRLLSSGRFVGEYFSEQLGVSLVYPNTFQDAVERKK